MTEIELWVTERDGTRIAPLPEANLESITWDLNDVGTAQFSIDPLSEGASEIEGIMREIQIWMDGELQWWGVPWGLTGGPASINVSCEGLLSLFNKRFVDRTSLLYTSLEQFTIAWNLLLYAQSEAVEAHRDFNIDLTSPFVPSGVVRSRNYKREEHKCILDLVKEFDGRTLLNGFDFEIRHTGDGGRFFTPYYPRKGQLVPNASIEWDSEGDRNIADFSWTEDFLPVCTLAYVTGGSVSTGSVSIRKEGKYEDTAWSAYWGQMQSVISEGTQLDEEWLDDRAQQEVDSRKEPAVNFALTSAIAVDGLQLGDVVVGDWLPVNVDHGRIQIPNVLERVHQVKWNANDTLDFTFGEVVAA